MNASFMHVLVMTSRSNLHAANQPELYIEEFLHDRPTQPWRMLGIFTTRLDIHVGGCQ